MLISGLLEVSDQSAIVVVFSVMNLLYAIPLSFGLTISALIGQSIGSGNIAKARLTMWLTMLTASFVMINVSIIVYIYGGEFIEGIVENETIKNKSLSNLRMYSIIYLIDGTQLCLQSVIKALGLQEKVKYCTLFNYFLISLSFAYFFAIYCEVGINGLWYGAIIGLISNSACYIFVIYCSDWKEISESCQDEMELELDFLIMEDQSSSKNIVFDSQKDDHKQTKSK